MLLRKLNPHGLDAFADFLDHQRIGTHPDYPEVLLHDNATSEIVVPQVEVEIKVFGNRFEAAKYLNERLSHAGITNLGIEKGIWAWLALLYFDELCPAGKDGQRMPGEPARWIPEISNYRKYYRHLLAGPYRIYMAHSDAPQRAMALLCGQLHRPGEVVEQLSARQELVTNKGVVELATMLYCDKETYQLKRGSSGKGAGSPRRLADIFNQFDVTWDLYSMTATELQLMLPPEFERFWVA